MLGRFIPDFGKIVAMMQFNMYHHYTVDEHLIRAIGVLVGDPHRAPDRGSSALGQDPAVDQGAHDGADRRALPARHRQGPAGGPLDRRRQGGAAALSASRPLGQPDGARRLARRGASDDVAGRAVARPCRPPHHPRLRRRHADARPAEAASGADGLRHPRRRPRRVERLEGAAPALALLRDRADPDRRLQRRVADLAAGSGARSACRAAQAIGRRRSASTISISTIPAYWLRVDEDRQVRHAAFVRARRRGRSCGSPSRSARWRSRRRPS